MMFNEPDHRRDIGTKGPMSDGPFLIEEEVNNLPDGTVVEVMWDGSNGPYKYRKESDRFGNTIITLLKQPEVRVGDARHLGGSGSPLTKIKLAKQTT